jgi:osmotically-inducible protein OsmY
VDASFIDVNVTNGRVILTGMVRSAWQKKHAYQAGWVAGVSSVDDSAITVDWLIGEQTTEQKAYGVIIPSNIELARAVKDAFLYDPRVYAANIQVEADAGTITLTGVVDNLKAKKAAEQDAKNAVGVLQVKNHLRVRPKRLVPGDEIQKNVLGALKRDVFLGRNNTITVSVNNARVHLYGTVHSNYEKARAEDVTSRVKGVIAVKNGLGVHSVWIKKTDWEILQDIADQLRWDPLVNDKAIEVTVTDGVATLTGAVDAWTERDVAIRNAYEGGARQVNDRLTIKKHAF